MENSLNNIVGLLKCNPLALDHSNADGRVNSIDNEDTIMNFLMEHFSNIEKPSIRNWYDFAIIGHPRNVYVNVKVSDLSNSAADNLSSKLGMGYALTGIENMPTTWEKFHTMLADNLRIGYDYYFLVVNKNNSTDCFWTSLKRIKTLVANGNNLPFQCNWAQNRDFSTRSELEAMKYILSVYISSWDKKAKGYPFEIKELLERDKLLDN